LVQNDVAPDGSDRQKKPEKESPKRGFRPNTRLGDRKFSDDEDY
jgi:hypothetical protein